MRSSALPTGDFGSSSEAPVLVSYVDLLWQLTQPTNNLPTYRVEMEGTPDNPFRCIVRVGTEHFPSSRYFAQRGQAKEDAARVAYEILLARENKSEEFAKAFHFIDQEATPCMVILNEFNKKANIALPSSYVVEPNGHHAHFIASVLVGGNSYTGESASTEEQAMKNAAHTAVKSILATRNECMLEIILSKRQTGITIQGGLPSEMNIPPVVTAAISSVAYIPCASNELMQQLPPNMAVLPHEHMQQQYAPFPPISFLFPDELMKRNTQAANMTSEMTNRPLPQAIPVGDVANSLPGISVNEYQDDNMIVDVNYEEYETLSGKKRKMDPNEGPMDKQARTTL